MKIMFLSDAASIHTARWTRYFASRGHVVHLLSFNSFIDPPPNGVKLHRLKYLHSMPIVSSPINLLLGVLQIRSLARIHRIDLLNAHYLSNYGVLGSLSGIHPFVASAWGSDVLRLDKDTSARKFLIVFCMRVADAVTTTAIETRDYILNAFNLNPSKVVRIPWGIDLGIFHRGYADEVIILKKSLGLEPEMPVILSNRTMSENYTIDSIVNSIPKVLSEHPNAVFLFIRGYGTPEYEKKMNLKARDMGILKNIRIISKLIPPEEMAVFLNASNAFISLPKTDQFASSIMEGMACGSIPILSNLSVYKQYLKDKENAFFVNPDDPEEIASAVNFCIDNPSIREEFYTINRRIIEEEEDWSNNAKKMEELFEALIARRSH